MRSDANQAVILLIAICGILLAYYVFRTILAMRHALLRAAILTGGLVVLWLSFNARALELHFPPAQAAGMGLLIVLFFVVFIKPKKRTRRIPSHIRRAVIARDLKGEPFDPRKHHIDHIKAWSQGGGHTMDNLRVINKTENLRKGKKNPKLRDWF